MDPDKYIYDMKKFYDKKIKYILDDKIKKYDEYNKIYIDSAADVEVKKSVLIKTLRNIDSAAAIPDDLRAKLTLLLGDVLIIPVDKING